MCSATRSPEPLEIRGHRVLLVEDEVSARSRMRAFLEGRGQQVSEAGTCAEARAILAALRPDAVVLDYALPDGSALELLAEMKELAPNTPALILTGHARIDLAVEAIKAGAEHFLTKPVDLSQVWVLLQRVLEGSRARRQQVAAALRQQRQAIDPFALASPALRALSEQAKRVVASGRPVLILGETGTGKSAIAAWLHRNGPRAGDAFVELNCASLSKELLESELFGHVRGAYTGAANDKAGLFEIAHRGTVFLDEIGDLDAAAQPKLLTVLESKKLRRVGDVKERLVDAQLLAATHQDLRTLVAERRFREDLYFRISTLTLRLPPLRERSEDIPALAEQILGRLANELGRPRPLLSPNAVRRLVSYAWPGNIRELRNVLERAALLTEGDVIEADGLLLEDRVAVASREFADLTLDEAEALLIRRALEREQGHVERAAMRLGLSRSALYKKLARQAGSPSSTD